MPPHTLALIAVLAVLLVMSGLCSASETALFRLTQRDRATLARTRPRSARAVSRLLDAPSGLLVTILILNMLINIAYFAIASALAVAHADGVMRAVFSIGPLLALILCGEVVPKLLAGWRRVAFASVVAPALLLIRRALTPVRFVVEQILVRPILRLIWPDGVASAAASLSELHALIGLSGESGALDAQEQALLRDIVNLASRRVREVMVPRRDMDWLDLGASPDEIAAHVAQTRHTRVPVFEATPDAPPVGVLNTRSYLLRLRREATPPETREFLETALIIPENTRLDRMLATFRDKGASLAVCVDEFGSVTGSIEIENLGAALSLPLASRRADPRDQIVSPAPDVWVVPGRLSLSDLADVLDLDGDRVSRAVPSVTTVAGVVSDRLGRLPRIGDHAEFLGFHLLVERVRHRTADRVRITPATHPK
ncbi:MAG: HlyC/CorC family transporter [Phycisphaeraceae bacterium]|nr:HlyC/CorC family transporter [Phycisphaeraceae bacterium]